MAASLSHPFGAHGLDFMSNDRGSAPAEDLARRILGAVEYLLREGIEVTGVGVGGAHHVTVMLSRRDPRWESALVARYGPSLQFEQQDSLRPL